MISDARSLIRSAGRAMLALALALALAGCTAAPGGGPATFIVFTGIVPPQTIR